MSNLPNAHSREEILLKAIAESQAIDSPDPKSRVEIYLKQIMENGSISPEEIQAAVDAYLAEHPLDMDASLVDPLKAAPAGVVGERLSELKGDLVDINNAFKNGYIIEDGTIPLIWEVGMLNASDGSDYWRKCGIRTVGYFSPSKNFNISVADGFTLTIYSYRIEDDSFYQQYSYTGVNTIVQNAILKYRFVLKEDSTSADEILSDTSISSNVIIKYDDTNIKPEWINNIDARLYRAEGHIANKVGYAFGDSVTANGLYLAEVNRITGIDFVNFGLSSSTIAINSSNPIKTSIVERICGLNGNLAYYKADVWIVNGGLNDCMLSTPLGNLQPTGTTFDNTTVYGALQSICEYILSKKEHPRLILMTPTQSIRDNWDESTYPTTIKKIRKAFIDVAEYYSIKCVDLWKESGINAFNMQKTDNSTTKDGVHPNELGAELMAPCIAKAVIESFLGE